MPAFKQSALEIVEREYPRPVLGGKTPPHPPEGRGLHLGILIKKRLMKNHTPKMLARWWGIDEKKLEGILAGEEPITRDIAAKLAKFSGMSEQFFHNLQFGDIKRGVGIAAPTVR
ncbi:MAG: hypothetical protein P4M15_05555 [Alphaproteobacteria bacterium]|nr:hypothetical protein [Alphaproteobacteria bacterium]